MPQVLSGPCLARMASDCLRCLRCGRRSTREEAYCDLALDVSLAISLEQALREYTAWETLDGDNCWRCDVCNEKVPALLLIGSNDV